MEPINYSTSREISNLLCSQENKYFWDKKNSLTSNDLSQKLCVVIPNFNNVNIIEQVIKSIQTEIHPNVSISIIDNHSTDGSWEYLKELSKNNSNVSIIQTPFNTGPHYTAQLILKSSLYEYTMFASGNDLIINQNIIGKMVSYLEERPGVNLIYGRNIRNSSFSEPEEFTFSIPCKSNREKLGLSDIDCFNLCTWLYTSSEPLWGIYRSNYAKLIPNINNYGSDHMMLSSVAFYGGITGINIGLKDVAREERSHKTLRQSQNQRFFLNKEVNIENTKEKEVLPLDNSNMLSLMYTYFNGIELMLTSFATKDLLIQNSCKILIRRFWTLALYELRGIDNTLFTNSKTTDYFHHSFLRELIKQKSFLVKIIIPIIKEVIMTNIITR